MHKTEHESDDRRLERSPLNILQVGSCMAGWGGAELHLIRLSKELARRGHQVTVACQPGRFVEREARQQDLQTLPATVVRQQDWRDRQAFLRCLRQQAIHVVHVHWSGDYIVPPALARLCHVPAVLMSRHSPDRLKSSSGRFLYGRVLFDQIIAVSDSVRQTLLSQKIPANKVVTIHNSIDPTSIRQTTLSPETLRAGWDIPEGALLVGMVGRIAWEKGIPIFLDALARLQGNQPAIYGVIVGDGPQREEVEARARELSLGKRLIFAGFRSDANDVLQALDAFVLASVWQEPCATVVLEAMALGKPVIGTRAGGTPELIVPEETGWLTPPGDAEALAIALQRMAALSPERCREMGEAGRARVEKHFTLTRMTDQIEDIYYKQIALKTKAMSLP